MCVFSDTLKYLYLFILAASGMDILTQTKHFANAWTVSGIFLFCLCELVCFKFFYTICVSSLVKSLLSSFPDLCSSLRVFQVISMSSLDNKDICPCDSSPCSPEACLVSIISVPFYLFFLYRSLNIFNMVESLEIFFALFFCFRLIDFCLLEI